MEQPKVQHLPIIAGPGTDPTPAKVNSLPPFLMAFMAVVAALEANSQVQNDHATVVEQDAKKSQELAAEMKNASANAAVSGSDSTTNAGLAKIQAEIAQSAEYRIETQNINLDQSLDVNEITTTASGTAALGSEGRDLSIAFQGFARYR